MWICARVGIVFPKYPKRDQPVNVNNCFLKISPGSACQTVIFEQFQSESLDKLLKQKCSSPAIFLPAPPTCARGGACFSKFPGVRNGLLPLIKRGIFSRISSVSSQLSCAYSSPRLHMCLLLSFHCRLHTPATLTCRLTPDSTPSTFHDVMFLLCLQYDANISPFLLPD